MLAYFLKLSSPTVINWRPLNRHIYVNRPRATAAAKAHHTANPNDVVRLMCINLDVNKLSIDQTWP
jgi:hypothetical protein